MRYPEPGEEAEEDATPGMLGPGSTWLWGIRRQMYRYVVYIYIYMPIIYRHFMCVLYIFCM